MRRRYFIPLLLVVGAVIPCSAQTSHLSQVLAKIALSLQHRTSVPLRLPDHIPDLDNETELYAITRSVDAMGYWVVLAATPDCQGQHVCSYGFFIGTTRPVTDFVGDRRGSPVALHNDVKGLFYDMVCGAYCDESMIAWSEGKYHYIIGLKAEKKSTLMLAANSAIGHAQHK